MKKFLRYSVSGLFGWLGYGFVLAGLIMVVISLFRQEFRWDSLFVPLFGVVLIYTSYCDGRDKRFEVPVQGNELDIKIYKWIIKNGLSSMEELKKLDPPSETILDRMI